MVIEFNPDIKENTGVWLPDGDALMKWAREQAPSEPSPCGPYVSGRRRVRLEISQETTSINKRWGCSLLIVYVAKVYLAEPRCWIGITPDEIPPIPCPECGPLAERRIK